MAEGRNEVRRERRSSPALRLKLIRQIHLYLGVFFAPSLIFFALTGAIQLFGLHEQRPGRNYQPPALIASLAAVHKDQRFGAPPEHAEGPDAHGGPPDHHDGPQDDHHDDHHGGPGGPAPISLGTLLLKWFFLATAVGLIGSTCLGLWMGLKYSASRRLAVGLLVIGAVIPVLLLML